MFKEMEIGCRSHFLDSGSFSLWTIAERWATENGKTPQDYYGTPAFFEYIDAYAQFIKKHKKAIDYYANVDAIGFPELTWRNQRYLEKKHGLMPVPVIHYKTDLSWLTRYITRRGGLLGDRVEGKHDLIALGGLVGSTAQDHCRKWLDAAFDIVCDQPGRLPRTRIHGFGVTSFPLLLRYPWWSVDSTTWTMVGAMGGILVPHKRHGKWVYKDPFPYVVKFSEKSKEVTMAGKHFMTMKPGERAVVQSWLDELGVPLGTRDKDGEIAVYGVTNRHCERKAANLLFFERLRKTLPKYPWAFRGAKVTTLGIKVENGT